MHEWLPLKKEVVKRYWVGGWLKDARRIAHPVESYWVRGDSIGKKIEEYPGLS